MVHQNLVILSVALIFAGCTSSLWKKIDEAETAASFYGTVAVGAPRIANYDNAAHEASRERLRVAIGELRKGIDETLKPEISSAQWSERAWYLKLGVDLGSIVKFPTPDKDNQIQDIKKDAKSEDKNSITLRNIDALKDLLKDMNIEPNRIDAQIYKLSVLRFLESELESLNLNLSNPVDSSHYRRVQVSVSLTAWTTPPAVSALVYLDLYPLNGDWLCHEAGKAVEKVQEEHKEELMIVRRTNQELSEELWKELKDIMSRTNQELSKTFSHVDLLSEKDVLEWLKTPNDPYTNCHRWLIDTNLLPKLVHVEPLGDSRYVMINQGSETYHDTGLDVNAASYGTLRAGQQGRDAGLAKSADIRLTAISFAAGDRRAGWFFRGDTESKTMRPLERRLRMVVDIPRNLKALDLHVHKSFLNKKNRELALFSTQTEGLHRTRWLLDDIEHVVVGAKDCEEAKISREHCYPSETYWQLAKSRVRNLLSLGWSERLVAHISEPAEQNLKYAVRANVVSPDIPKGSSNQFLIIDGDRIKDVIREKSSLPDGYLRIEDFGEDYVYPGFIDTHNHPHYNFIPQWLPSKPEGVPERCNPYCNRYQWQKEKRYKTSVKEAYEKLETSGHGIDGLRYGHLRALAGGVTTIQGGEDPGQQPTQLRTLWKHSASSTTKVAELRDSDRLKEYKAALDGKTIKRLFLHVAEGIDAESKEELTVLEQAGLLGPEVVLIHAIPFGTEELRKIKERRVSLVWSPRSNLALYGQTMDIGKVVENKIPIALAPDWTITGSSNMLQELRCAREYADAKGLINITNDQLYRMVTESAAHIAGLEKDGHLLAGKLASDTYADFVVIKKRNDNPFDNLLAVTEEDIRLIVIGGQPVFGEPKFFSLVSRDFPVDYVDIGNSVKAVRLAPNRESGAHSTNNISVLQQHLAQSWPLAPIRESPSKSCRVPRESP